MAISKQPSNFNPAQLQPAGQSERKLYGPERGENTEYVTVTPMVGPDGKHYIAQDIPGQGVQYISKEPDGKTMNYFEQRNPDGSSTGQWAQKEFQKTGAWDLVLKDEKFMAFLTVAAGGVAGAYASGAAANPTFASVGSTGYGGAGMPAFTGGGAASAGTGAIGAGGAPQQQGANNPINSDANAAYSDSAQPGYNDHGFTPGHPGGTSAGWPAVQEAASKAGMSVADFVSKNPGLVSSLVGGVLGYLGNKDDKTSTSTSTTSLDPAAQAYNDKVRSSLQGYAGSQTPYSPGGGTPGGVNWGGTNPSPGTGAKSAPAGGLLASANPQQFAGVQGGSPADFAPGGRFSKENVGRMMAEPASTQANWLGGPEGSGGFTDYMPQLGGKTAPATGTGGGLRHYGDAGGSNFVNQAGPGGNMTAQPKQSGVPLTPGAGGMPDWSGSNSYMPQVNQYLQEGTKHLDATGNPLAGENNPYLTKMIGDAGQDMRQNYEQMVAPKFSSGSSFGNSGLGFLEVHERDRQADNFGQLSNQLRFADHNLRANLLESGAGRQDQLNSGARDNSLTAGSTWGQLGANAGEFNATHDFDIFKQQQDEAYRRQQLLLMGTQMPSGTSTTTTGTQQGNPWAGAAGGAIAGGNLWKAWNSGLNDSTKSQIF